MTGLKNIIKTYGRWPYQQAINIIRASFNCVQVVKFTKRRQQALQSGDSL